MEINSNVEMRGTNYLTSAPAYSPENTWIQPSISHLHLSTVNQRIIDGIYSAVIDSFSASRNSDQAWFWTNDWQAGERRVDEYIQSGDFEEFDTIDDFLETLGGK